MNTLHATHAGASPLRGPFDAAEYAERLRRVRGAMAGAGLDVLLLVSPENIYYLSGYSAFSHYTHQVLIVPVDAVEPVLVLRQMDVACAHHTCWLQPENVIGYADEYVDSERLHPWSVFAERLGRMGLGRARAGLELDSSFLSARARDVLTLGCPALQIADATYLVNRLRLVKSSAEIAVMREAGEIADHAMNTAFEAIRPGVRECDAVARVVAAQIGGTRRFGGHVPSEPVLLGPAARADSPHLYWSDQPFASDVPVNVELGGVRHHYNVGLSRTLYLGAQVPVGLRRLADANRAAIDAALAAVRVGEPAGAIARAYDETLAARGAAKPSRVGYGIGIGISPAWIERSMSLRASETRPLEPNMTFHLMAGLWERDLSCVISETLIVTTSGAQTLSRVPQSVHALDGSGAA